ncbi:MAG: hypothetical protein RQ967_03360 [Candidatus Caldipriscus sp.]|nr:hypothetical protein [Candidatus Caldipriscus sp.]
MWKVCKPAGAPVGTLKVIVKLNVSSGGERVQRRPKKYKLIP